MKRLKRAGVCFAAAILLLLSGCWNYHELETYSIVSGVAVDKGQNGYKYHLSFECVDISETGENGGVQPLIIEADGNSVFDAVRSTQRESDKKLYFNHCKVVILSSGLAKEGIKPILDWFLRDAEPRVTLKFLVSKDPTAEEVLSVKPQSGQITAFQIVNTLGENASFYGSSPTMQLYEVNNTLNSDGIALTLPAIETKKAQNGTTVQLAGLSVFRGDRQIGWLDDLPSKYFAFVRGKIAGGLILTGEGLDAAGLTLEILRSKTEVRPRVSGDRVTIRIEVHLEATVGEQNSAKNYLLENGFEGIQDHAEKTLETGITGMVGQVQKQYGSDIFGFGGKIHEDLPDDWDRLKPKWNKLFQTVKVEVSAEVKLRNSARVVQEGGK